MVWSANKKKKGYHCLHLEIGIRIRPVSHNDCAICLVCHLHTSTQTCVSFVQESGFCENNGSHTCIGILSMPRCWSTAPRQPSPWPWQNLSGCSYTPVHVAPSMYPTVPKSGFQLLTLVAVGTRHMISPPHKSRSVLNIMLIFRHPAGALDWSERLAARVFSLRCVSSLSGNKLY